MMIIESQSDADNDTDDEDDCTQPPTAANISDDAGTTSTMPLSDDAVDSCEVCFVAPRDARFALVPCGHHVSRVPTQCTTKALAVRFAARASQ